MVKEAVQIDQETYTTFWTNAIKKEMKKVNIAFDFVETGWPNKYDREMLNGTLSDSKRLIVIWCLT
jgi:hypothetical protein